ncbi:MAG: helix-turn-helix domain-containing protein [Solirubrobacteraceae bacterium]
MDQSDASDSFLTVAEVAGILKLNQQTVRNWIDQGSLPALRVGRRVRIRRSDFERILAEGYTGSSGGASSAGGAGGPTGAGGSSGSGGSSASGGSGPSGGSGTPGAAGHGNGPTAEEFWGGEAVGLAPAMDNPAAGNGNSA